MLGYGFLVLLALAVEISADAAPSRDFTAKWIEYKYEFHKHYKNKEEELRRSSIVVKAIPTIEAHNKRFAAGEVSYELGLNELSDLTESEIESTLYGKNYTMDDLPIAIAETLAMRTQNVQVKSAVDWRENGAVTAVKNQGKCGSCWAFAATGAIEGAYFLKTGTLVPLSEQNLVDCSTANKGCVGGTPNRALNHVIANEGIATEAAYPYEGLEGNCRYESDEVGAAISGIGSTPKGNEQLLMNAVATKGPIAVATYSSLQTFRSYKSGVYNDPECTSDKQATHFMLIVGYNIDPKFGPYWLVKNSWGTTWGENGYVKMARGQNICGIAERCTFVNV